MNKPEKLSQDERGQSPPVFVSYATADRKEALSLCNAIERRGLNCWISTRDVRPGENYQEAIVRALRGSRAMVLVFSDAANNSDEIKKELSLASRYRVPVMAVRIEEVEPSDAFAYELSTRQWIDAFDNWDRSIDALVGTMDHVFAAESPTTASAVQPSRRANIGTKRRTLVAAATAAALLVAAGGAWLAFRPSGVSVHTMQVRLAGFQRLSTDLPGTMPQALADEINASFNDDGVVSVSTASAPSPGNSPAYALSGTIRREGEKIKVIVQLTNERTGTTLWSSAYSYGASSLARVPHLAAVDSSMVVRCGLFGASTYPKPMPDNVLIPYLGYCQGQDGPVADKALVFARKTVALAPDFSWGWSAVAVAGAGAWLSTNLTDEAVHKEALAGADQAIKIDPSNSEAYAYKAILIDKYDLRGQEALLKKAVTARPLPCGCEHHLYGSFLAETGRIKDAIAQFRAGVSVLPLNGSTQFGLGDALLADGLPEAANRAFDAAADLDSDATARQQMAVQAALATGGYAAAAKIVRDPKLPGTQQFRDAIAGAFEALASGSSQAKVQAVQRLQASPPGNTELAVSLLALLGAPSAALQLAEQRTRAGVGLARNTLWVPSMDSARRNPSFPALLERVGLMRYWRTTHTKPDVCTAKNAPPFCSMI